MQKLGHHHLDFERGQGLQAQADALTATRKWGGLAAAVVMATKGESWPLATAVVGLELTDKLDGHLARQGAELCGTETSKEGSEKDHITDKVFYYSHMSAIIIRDLVDGHYGSAAFVTANTASVVVRDWQMAKLRQRHAHKDTKAKRLNQIKTVEQDATIAFAETPLSTTETGRRVRNAGILAGNILSWVSYFRFKKSLED